MPEPDSFSDIISARNFTSGKSDVYVGLLAAAARSVFNMVLFTEPVSRRHTFVGGKCAPPSALLVILCLRFRFFFNVPFKWEYMYVFIVVVQLIQSRDKKFHLSTIRLLKALFPNDHFSPHEETNLAPMCWCVVYLMFCLCFMFTSVFVLTVRHYNNNRLSAQDFVECTVYICIICSVSQH